MTRGVLTVARRCAMAGTVVLTLLVPGTAAQAQTDVIRGRVTGIEGDPLMGVRVAASSVPGAVVRETLTNAQGNFQIVFPGGTGDYILSFGMVGYAPRQLQVKRLADEAVLVADVRLAPVQLDPLIVNVSPQQRVSRTGADPDVGGTEQTIPPDVLPPEQQGDIAALAASLPGILLVPGLDGGADGFSVLGLDADQNSVTLNGMPLGADGLPRDAAVQTSLVTSPFDVSRGGFSGANFNVRPRSGSNFRTRGASVALTAPQLQWTDRAAQALGNDYTNVSLSGMASGPLRRNRSFYNVSYQLGRQARDNPTLLSTSPLGLHTAGVATDSVQRFASILDAAGVPLGVGRAPAQRLSDNASVFGSVDFAPPTSASGVSYGLTFNGSWRRQRPLGGGQLALESTGRDQTTWNGTVQARHSAYHRLVLTETTAGINVSRQEEEPYLLLPGGRVRVNSAFEDGGSGVQTLSFGGSPSTGTSSRTVAGTFQNSLSWFDAANRHRLKLATELRLSGSEREQSQNLLGSFFFNSLEDLEAGRPAWYSRTLTSRQRTTGQLSGAVSLGDSYRHSPDLQIQAGVRLDASRYTSRPERNALVESVFGRRNDRIPTALLFSPRLGFSWTVGRAQEIEAFAGAARTPRAVIRGGVGVFANSVGSGPIGSVMDNTGLPGGVQQIMCVGPAAPVPDWTLYASELAAIPEQCADGTAGTVFSSAAPNVTLFADDWVPQHTVRSNLSWSGAVLDGRFSMSVEGTWSLNRGQQRNFDLNFDATERFTLPDGRPVFVAPTSIVPATGAIASRDARITQELARVSELRSDLRSRTAQLSVRLSPIARTPTRFGWSAAYTHTRVREQVSGFTSTAGDPLAVEWARAAQGPHQLTYNLRYRFFDAVQVSWNGSFRSGSAFTPMIAGDVNGDGYNNDRAYIHSPATAADPALAEGMQRLLESAPAGTRRCLEKQLESIAARNSCRGPWTSSASLTATLDRAKFRIPQRGAVTFSLSNPLGAADMLLHGRGGLKGWGQNAMPDASLLYVRGFEPETQTYRYEVNQRFGQTRPQFMTLRAPVVLTASVRVDLGPVRERQNLMQQLSFGRTQPGQRQPEFAIRSSSMGSITNPLLTILRQQDELALTALQADSIASMNRRYMYQADSLWTPLSRELAELDDSFSEDEVYARYLQARHAQVDMLIPIVQAARELLTPEQRRRLPQNVATFLDPRHLALIRNGTGMYVGGLGLGPVGGAAPGGGGMVMFESIPILRE